MTDYPETTAPVSDHPETTALRLAEAGLAQLSRDGLSWRACSNVYFAPDHTGELAAHIAHAHPGRVRAYALCVARLRERAKRGHTGECVITWHKMEAPDCLRALPARCTCGHEDDLAALAAVDAEG